MGNAASLPQWGPIELCKGSLNKPGSHKNMKHCPSNTPPWRLWRCKGGSPACWSRAGRGAQSLGCGDTWPEQGCPCPQLAPWGSSTTEVPGGAQQSQPSCSAATPAASLLSGKEGRKIQLTAQVSKAGTLPYRVLDRPCGLGWDQGDLGWEKADGKLQQVKKDPSGKGNPLKKLWQFYQPLQGWT